MVIRSTPALLLVLLLFHSSLLVCKADFSRRLLRDRIRSRAKQHNAKQNTTQIGSPGSTPNGSSNAIRNKKPIKNMNIASKDHTNTVGATAGANNTSGFETGKAPNLIDGNRGRGGLPHDLPPPEDGFGTRPPPSTGNFVVETSSGNDGTPGLDSSTNTTDAQLAPGFGGEAEIPEMERIPDALVTNGTVSGNSSTTGDIVDTPTVIDTKEGMNSSSDVAVAQLAPGFGGEAEIPKMESIPNARVAGGSGSGASSATGDIVDTPTVIDGEDGMTSSSEGADAQLAPGFGGEPEIPGMEPIPDALVQERSAELPQSSKNEKEEIPIILPFGESAESVVLHHTAAVCANSQEEAAYICTELPLCKFKVRNDDVTNEIVMGQGDCTRRCDSPLNERHCASHQQCYRFILGCQCPQLSFKGGGKCQPF